MRRPEVIVLEYPKLKKTKIFCQDETDSDYYYLKYIFENDKGSECNDKRSFLYVQIIEEKEPNAKMYFYDRSEFLADNFDILLGGMGLSGVDNFKGLIK